MPLRLGLVGLGVISRYYAAAMDRLPCLRLAAVCDLEERALEPYRGRVPCHSSHRALLTAGGVDALVVNVPNDAHAEVCRDALLAGRAVCVEKPLATLASDGRALVRLSRERSVPLFTAFHRRYNDNVQALVRRLPEAIPVEHVTVRYLERIEEHAGQDRWYLDPARCGGGCVADNGPNAFDLVRLFVGDVGVERADVERDGHGVDRRALVRLRGASAGATVELDWAYAGERKEVEVRLADGSSDGADMLAGHTGFKASLWHEYVALLVDFWTAVCRRAGRGEDGLAALDLVEQTYRAEGSGARTGEAAG